MRMSEEQFNNATRNLHFSKQVSVTVDGQQNGMTWGAVVSRFKKRDWLSFQFDGQNSLFENNENNPNGMTWKKPMGGKGRFSTLPSVKAQNEAFYHELARYLNNYYSEDMEFAA